MAELADSEKTPFGPTILMSGYLTKRTRTFLHWKRRWWQLLDNGTLLYFENQNRMKLLGQLDVTKTCYDVRLGAEHCRVPFPRTVPPGCCFAFSVLKRTYYVFSPTAAEAKQWVECITSVSAILNRRQVTFESSILPLNSPAISEKKNSNRRHPGIIEEQPKPYPEPRKCQAAMESSIPPPTGPSISEHKKKSNRRHTVAEIMEEQPRPDPEPRKCQAAMESSIPPPTGPSIAEHKKKSNRRHTVAEIMEEQPRPYPEPRKCQAAMESSIPPPTGPSISEHKKKSNRRHTVAEIMEEQPRPYPEPRKHHMVTRPVEDQHARELNELSVSYKHTGSSQNHDTAPDPLQYKRSVPNSKMWLDGSPSPQLLHEDALSQPTTSPPLLQRAKHRHHSANSAMFSSYDHNLHLKGLPASTETLPVPLHQGATLPRPQIKHKSAYQPLSTSSLALQFQRLQHREALIRRGLAMMEHPRRPNSVDFTTSLPHSYYLPSRPHIKSTVAAPAQTHNFPHHCSTSEILAQSRRRNVPPIVKPKPILRSPKGSLSPNQQEEFATATHVRSAALNSPKESETTASVNTAGLAYHHYHHHSRSRSSPGPISTIRELPDVEQPFMPPPPLTGPPPSRPPAPSPPDSPPPPNALEFLEPPPKSPQSDQFSHQTTAAPVWGPKTSLTSQRETNNWALSELRKLIFAIKRLGEPVGDEGRTAVTFRKLIDGTSGIFEALLGTLLAAKKHQLVDFEGDVLSKGRDDEVVITLLRDL